MMNPILRKSIAIIVLTGLVFDPATAAGFGLATPSRPAVGAEMLQEQALISRLANFYRTSANRRWTASVTRRIPRFPTRWVTTGGLTAMMLTLFSSVGEAATHTVKIVERVVTGPDGAQVSQKFVDVVAGNNLSQLATDLSAKAIGFSGNWQVLFEANKHIVKQVINGSPVIHPTMQLVIPGAATPIAAAPAPVQAVAQIIPPAIPTPIVNQIPLPTPPDLSSVFATPWIKTALIIFVASYIVYGVLQIRRAYLTYKAEHPSTPAPAVPSKTSEHTRDVIDDVPDLPEGVQPLAEIPTPPVVETPVPAASIPAAPTFTTLTEWKAQWKTVRTSVFDSSAKAQAAQTELFATLEAHYLRLSRGRHAAAWRKFYEDLQHPRTPIDLGNGAGWVFEKPAALRVAKAKPKPATKTVAPLASEFRLTFGDPKNAVALRGKSSRRKKSTQPHEPLRLTLAGTLVESWGALWKAKLAEQFESRAAAREAQVKFINDFNAEFPATPDAGQDDAWVALSQDVRRLRLPVMLDDGKTWMLERPEAPAAPQSAPGSAAKTAPVLSLAEWNTRWAATLINVYETALVARRAQSDFNTALTEAHPSLPTGPDADAWRKLFMDVRRTRSPHALAVGQWVLEKPTAPRPTSVTKVVAPASAPEKPAVNTPAPTPAPAAEATAPVITAPPAAPDSRQTRSETVRRVVTGWARSVFANVIPARRNPSAVVEPAPVEIPSDSYKHAVLTYVRAVESASKVTPVIETYFVLSKLRRAVVSHSQNSDRAVEFSKEMNRVNPLYDKVKLTILGSKLSQTHLDLFITPLFVLLEGIKPENGDTRIAIWNEALDKPIEGRVTPAGEAARVRAALIQDIKRVVILTGQIAEAQTALADPEQARDVIVSWADMIPDMREDAVKFSDVLPYTSARFIGYINELETEFAARLSPAESKSSTVRELAATTAVMLAVGMGALGLGLAFPAIADAGEVGRKAKSALQLKDLLLPTFGVVGLLLTPWGRNVLRASWIRFWSGSDAREYHVEAEGTPRGATITSSSSFWPMVGFFAFAGLLIIISPFVEAWKRGIPLFAAPTYTAAAVVAFLFTVGGLVSIMAFQRRDEIEALDADIKVQPAPVPDVKPLVSVPRDSAGADDRFVFKPEIATDSAIQIIKPTLEGLITALRKAPVTESAAILNFYRQAHLLDKRYRGLTSGDSERNLNHLRWTMQHELQQIVDRVSDSGLRKALRKNLDTMSENRTETDWYPEVDLQAKIARTASQRARLSLVTNEAISWLHASPLLAAMIRPETLFALVSALGLSFFVRWLKEPMLKGDQFPLGKLGAAVGFFAVSPLIILFGPLQATTSTLATIGLIVGYAAAGIFSTIVWLSSIKNHAGEREPRRSFASIGSPAFMLVIAMAFWNLSHPFAPTKPTPPVIVAQQVQSAPVVTPEGVIPPTAVEVAPAVEAPGFPPSPPVEAPKVEKTPVEAAPAAPVFAPEVKKAEVAKVEAAKPEAAKPAPEVAPAPEIEQTTSIMGHTVRAIGAARSAAHARGSSVYSFPKLNLDGVRYLQVVVKNGKSRTAPNMIWKLGGKSVKVSANSSGTVYTLDLTGRTPGQGESLVGEVYPGANSGLSVALQAYGDAESSASAGSSPEVLSASSGGLFGWLFLIPAFFSGLFQRFQARLGRPRGNPVQWMAAAA